MNPNQITDKNFYAEDIFLKWIELVKIAQTSVIIISPYVGGVINELIKNAKDGVEIKIITRIDEESLSKNCTQLKALINAKSQKAKIYCLPKLHAKILMIDKQMLSLGSQNFTNGGRSNKEASFSSFYKFKSNSYILRTISNWERKAKSVSETELNDLYKELKEDCISFNRKKKKLKKKIQDIKKRHEKEDRNLVTKRKAILTYYTNTNYLSCRQSEHLTSWIKKQKNTELDKNFFYPLLNVDTGQMIFARINKTRISFVDNRKQVGRVKIGKKVYNVLIVLPKTNYEESNIRILLKRKKETIKLRCIYNGKNILFDPKTLLSH